MEEIFVLQGGDIGDFDEEEDGENSRRNGELNLVSRLEGHGATEI